MGNGRMQRLFPAETAALWMGCPLDVTSPFVKKQFRNARRRFGTASKKIIPLNMRKVQQRRPPPVAETGRSCWGRGQQDASGSEADAGSRNPGSGMP